MKIKQKSDNKSNGKIDIKEKKNKPIIIIIIRLSILDIIEIFHMIYKIISLSKKGMCIDF